MKKVPVTQAVGMTLCHDITKMVDGFKGPVFRRGHVIEEKDVQTLLDIGKRHIFIWEEHAGELHEEDCALRLSRMAPVAGAHYTVPSEGKTLLIADTDGMFFVDTALMQQVNRIPDVTIATLPNHYPVKKGARLASMRIIPLVTKEQNIIDAEALCRGRRLLSLLPYQKKKAGVIITGSEVYHGRIQDKFEPVIRGKLAQYPCDVVGVTKCDDDLDMIIAAAQAHLANGADLLILTGGMSVDPDDLTPTAIRRLGADIIRYGVPAQPGNMTLVAYLGEVPVLGVPGASISLPTTIFDCLLPQIFTGRPLTYEELTNLSEGGLCQMCPDCHFPNCTFGRY